MSRCFPYPPPVYVRNPVAVAVAEAESAAKLQKEREKAEKKKEKRNDKKAIQHGETSKHSKHSHKKRKHDEASTAGPEPKKFSEESVETLEKSGLSEEHGAPCFVQTIHDSPESSQDSSKRRKVLPSPSQAKNGNIVRIKIKSNQDSQAGVLEKPRVNDQPLAQQMGSASLLSDKQNSIQKYNKGNARSVSAAQQRISGDSQAARVSTETPAKIMQRVAPLPAAKARQPVAPQLSLKAPVGRSDPRPPKFLGSANPSPLRVMGRSDPSPSKMAQRVEHPSAKVLQKVDPQLPNEGIQRKSSEVSMKMAQKGTRSDVHLPVAPQFLALQKPVDLLVPKQQQDEPVAMVPKEEPCSSGRDAVAVPVREVKLSRSDRKKIRKVEKKEKKFRDLFITWNPVSTAMADSDLGELDWLLGSTRNSDASMANCRASDDLVPIHSMEQQPSLQPRATFLPDLNIYQLPYVIPF